MDLCGIGRPVKGENILAIDQLLEEGELYILK